MSLITVKNNNSKKLFVIIFSLSFIVFLFTSDAHRYSLDEAHATDMSYSMATGEIHPLYVQGESKFSFNVPIMNPYNLGLLCTNGITCYPPSVFYTATQVPFIAANHFFQIITHDTVSFTTNDFVDQHYIFWRNSEKPDLVFMELFYGPLFTALSISVFFLICLEYKFTKKTSVILSLLLAFTTMMWAYSNTSINIVPSLFFILLGFLFYKKFQTCFELKFLLFSSLCLGFAFLIREASILFIIPIFGILLIDVFRKNTKILPFSCFTVTLIFIYLLSKYAADLKVIQSTVTTAATVDVTNVASGFIPHVSTLIPMFGLLFAPGLGLFIFSPILLTMFFTFPDFFRKHKSDCILFSSFFLIMVFYFANLGITWHGLIGWGARYLLVLTPFLLLPLGSSLEKRNKRFMFILIIILGALGIFFNVSYVIQDNSWFVWGTPGGSNGLYGLGIPNAICDRSCQNEEADFYINNLTIWSFQYSQLTHSISLMFQGLQHDIYLLHLFGTFVYTTLFVSLCSVLFYLFLRIVRYDKISLDNSL